MIFQQLEATTLLCLHTFNAIIRNYLERSDARYKQCVKDIPRKHWYTLFENSLELIKIILPLIQSEEYDRYDHKTWITLYKPGKNDLTLTISKNALQNILVLFQSIENQKL